MKKEKSTKVRNDGDVLLLPCSIRFGNDACQLAAAGRPILRLKKTQELYLLSQDRAPLKL